MDMLSETQLQNSSFASEDSLLDDKSALLALQSPTLILSVIDEWREDDSVLEESEQEFEKDCETPGKNSELSVATGITESSISIVNSVCGSFLEVLETSSFPELQESFLDASSSGVWSADSTINLTPLTDNVKPDDKTVNLNIPSNKLETPEAVNVRKIIEIKSDSSEVLQSPTKKAERLSNDKINSVESNEISNNAPKTETVIEEVVEEPTKTIELIDLTGEDSEANDNTNPDWEFLRKLETDDERYRAVRQRWKNLQIANPLCDLTCHNKLASKWSLNSTKFPNTTQNQLTGTGPCSEFGVSRKRKHSVDCDEWEGDDNSFVPPWKRRRVTEIFNEKIRMEVASFQNAEESIRMRHDQGVRQLAFKHSDQIADLRNYEWNHFGANMYAKEQHLVKRQMEELQHFHNDYRLRIDIVANEHRTRVDNLIRNRDEAVGFLQFYSNLKNSSTENKNTLILNEFILQHLQETEEMYDFFKVCYK